VNTYDIQWLPGENIVVECISADFSIKDDTIPSNRVIIALLESVPGPMPYILDVTDISVTFGDMVGVLGAGTRGEAPAYIHRNISELLVVTQSVLITLGVQALAQAQYGGLKTHIFSTREEALTYARSIAPTFERI
jgi:hypothetical protein